MQVTVAENNYVNKAGINNLGRIKQQLTFRSKFGGDEIRAFVETPSLFGFPRYYKLNGCELDDWRQDGKDTGFLFLGKPRSYQTSAIEQFQKLLNKNETAATLSAQTGCGKTVMIIKFLTMIGKTALIVVPKSDLIDQWRESLLGFTNIKPEEIGIARQSVCEYRGKKVTIGTIQSLAKDKYSQEFKDYFGVIVIDELHRTGAAGFSNIMKIYPARYRIGCSATLERADGLSVLFRLHMGQREIKVIKEMPKPNIIVYKYGKSSGKIQSYLKDVKFRRAALFSMLAENIDRINVICNLVAQLAKKRQVCILSERKILAKRIRNLLIESYDLPSNKVGLFTAETSQKQRERIALECTVISATTKMLSEGTDIPTLRALVFATPLSGQSLMQPLGRIRRLKDGLEEPVVLDFVDTYYKEAKRWHTSRLKLYRENNFNVQVM